MDNSSVTFILCSYTPAIYVIMFGGTTNYCYGVVYRYRVKSSIRLLVFSLTCDQTGRVMSNLDATVISEHRNGRCL